MEPALEPPGASGDSDPVPATAFAGSTWALVAAGDLTKHSASAMKAARLASTFGPFAVEARLGSGGMGVVYRGRHLKTGQRAAIKTVLAGGPELIASFRREVQVLAGLSHPGIVRILDEGVTGVSPWYAMQLVEGRPLSSLLRGPPTSQTMMVAGREPPSTSPAESIALPHDAPPGEDDALADRPPLRELLGIVRRVCEALSFVHAHGLVHRDLKPENILIEPDGNPVLVDFGVVGQFGDSAGREVLALSGSAGTLAYMAPEQALGGVVDARADLFSLGCILYECITLRPPFGPAGFVAASASGPPLPSSLVPGLSPELEELVLGLLARDVHDRLGYAKDVARRLDRLLDGEAPGADSEHGSEPTYLYRPELVGRERALEQLCDLVDAAKQGRGGFALVGGESGIGKTRLLLELAGRAAAAGATIITGECEPVRQVMLDAETHGEPLHPFRRFLLAVADACRAGGPEVTARLLGGRGAVLARYEPALASLLPQAPPPPEGESPERARARVFGALESLLAAFSPDRPLLLLLDDLQWADGLSLEFLSLLASHPQARSRVCVVATFRSEETSAELLALSQQAGVVSAPLGPFDRQAVSDMVSGMLALRAPPPEWVSFLHAESGGNPFFIAEYLRAAIGEGLLTRSPVGRWSLGEVDASASLRERIGLPATLSALVGRRLSGLDAEALQLVRAIAVLGRELDTELVARTAGVERGRVTAAYARLRQRQILGHEAAGSSGFMHDKLREVVCSLIDDDQRRVLHQRAAAALRARREERGVQVDAAVLGYHHARASEHENAAASFEEAAHAARRGHANRDAQRYFRLALSELARQGDESGSQLASSARLREALAEVLLVLGEYEDARAELERALDETLPSERVTRARRRRLLARTWERRHQHERALALCAAAEQELGEAPLDTDAADAFWHEAVQIQTQSAWHLYFLARVPELNALLARVKPMIETRGSPLQRAQFFQHLVHVGLREGRYRISQEIIDHAQSSLAAAEQTGDAGELALARFSLAFMLTFSGHEPQAEPLFLAAIAHVERAEDAALQARFVAYYSVMLRRQRRPEQVTSMALRALEIASQRGLYDYVGVAHASLSWALLQSGGDVETEARRALEAWAKLPPAYPYPLQWMALVPLAAELTRAGRLDEALASFKLLLSERQHQLPERLSAAIEHAEPDATSLLELVNIAEELRYI